MSDLNDEVLNDMIDEWHDNDSISCHLHTYLGMSWEEYRDWVELKTLSKKKKTATYNINTELLLNAMNYYKSIGFEPIDTPLLVSDQAINFTLPANVRSKKHLDLNYVGSAEQSFYQLLLNDSKLSGDFMLISPCQRYDTPSETHLNIFLKLELISTHKTGEEILQAVFDFYFNYLGTSVKPEIIKTSEGFDININGIEVGSFGSRFILNKWISYGTGLALPRISYALTKNSTGDL